MSDTTRPLRWLLLAAGLAIIGAPGIAQADPVTLVFNVDVTRSCPRNLGDPPCGPVDVTFDLTVSFLDPPNVGPAHSGHRQQSRWPGAEFSDVPLGMANPFSGVLTHDAGTILFDRSNYAPALFLDDIFISHSFGEETPAGAWSANFYLSTLRVEPKLGPAEPPTLDDLVRVIAGGPLNFRFFSGATNAAGEISHESRYYDGTARLDLDASTIPDALPPVLPVPEPGTAGLLGLAFVALARRQWPLRLGAIFERR